MSIPNQKQEINLYLTIPRCIFRPVVLDIPDIANVVELRDLKLCAPARDPMHNDVPIKWNIRPAARGICGQSAGPDSEESRRRVEKSRDGEHGRNLRSWWLTP